MTNALLPSQAGVSRWLPQNFPWVGAPVRGDDVRKILEAESLHGLAAALLTHRGMKHREPLHGRCQAPGV